jgi:hypothetical protein
VYGTVVRFPSVQRTVRTGGMYWERGGKKPSHGNRGTRRSRVPIQCDSNSGRVEELNWGLSKGTWTLNEILRNTVRCVSWRAF